jgi:hypothetical protein
MKRMSHKERQALRKTMRAAHDDLQKCLTVQMDALSRIASLLDGILYYLEHR